MLEVKRKSCYSKQGKKYSSYWRKLHTFINKILLFAITGNPRTYGRMKDDIDFCAAPALTGDRSLDDLSDDLLELVSRVAQGERTNAERLGHREGILYFNYQDPEKVPCEWHF